MAELMIECDTQEQWNTMMEELSSAVKEILEVPPTGRDGNAFLAFRNTFQGIVECHLDYLPPGEKKETLDICNCWLDIGLVFGRSPSRLAEIMEKAGAKVVKVEE